MILVKLNDFPITAGLEHQTTSYWLYRDPDCTMLVDEQLKSSNKTVYFNSMSIPRDVAFYLKYKRHFNEEDADFEGDVVEVYDNGEEYSEMLLMEDAVVDEPIINIDIETIRKATGSFNLTTSDFRSNYGKHEYTNWVIMDGTDTVLFSSVRDRKNLTSIQVPLLKDFLNKTELKFFASHGTLENVESRFGQFRIDSGSFNFEVVTSLTNVRAYVDLDIVFKAIDKSRPLGINKIHFEDTITNEIYLDNLKLKNNRLTLPWYLVRDGSDINMVIHCVDNYGKSCTITKKIVAESYRQDIIINPDKDYAKFLSKAYRSNVKIPNNIVTGVLNNRYIGIPDQDTRKIKLYDYDSKTKRFVNVNREANGITLLNYNIEGTLITPFNSNYLLIDSLSSSGYPTFYIYRHVIHNDSFALVTSIERNTETKSLGYTNGIVQHNQDTFIYVPVGTKDVYKLDVKKSIVEKIDTVPFNTAGNITIIKLAMNKLLFMGSSSYETKQYNVDKKVWTEGVYVRPQSFVNVDLKANFLDNGSSIIYKTNEDDVSDPSVLFYEYGGSQLDRTSCRFNHMFPKSSIRLPNGVVLLTCLDKVNHGERPHRPPMGSGTGDGDTVVLDPDRFEYQQEQNAIDVVGRKIAFNGADLSRESLLDPDKNVLIVGNNKVEVIQDPYIYDRIEIKGTGIVQWINNEVNERWDSGTLIATRDRTVSEEFIENKRYEDIVILDNVEFTIESGSNSSGDGDVVLPPPSVDDVIPTPPDDGHGPDYIAPDDLTNPTYTIFYEFK